MDLWIRTQDKRGIAKINEDIVVIGTVIRKLLNNENCWTDLGTYATEERALEILDEIQKLLSPIYNLQCQDILSRYDLMKMQKANKFYLVNDRQTEIKEISKGAIVYEMPKE